MQVVLLSDRAGISWFQAEGAIVDVSNVEGERLIAAGQAERINNNQAGAESSNPADISHQNKHRNRRK